MLRSVILIFTILTSLQSYSATVAKKHRASSQNEMSPFSIQEYRKIYAISGNPDTKLQISFETLISETFPIRFGYTQSMYWDLLIEESSPFSDVSYNPELFHRFKDIGWGISQVEFGYSHLSNGKDSNASRSVEQVFLTLYFGKPVQFAFMLKPAIHLGGNSAEYPAYVSPLKARVQLHKLFEHEPLKDLYLSLYPGGRYGQKWGRTGIEAGIQYRIFGNLASPSLFLQYYRGYGERLVTFDTLREGIRIGLSLGETPELESF